MAQTFGYVHSFIPSFVLDFVDLSLSGKMGEWNKQDGDTGSFDVFPFPKRLVCAEFTLYLLNIKVLFSSRERKKKAGFFCLF